MQAHAQNTLSQVRSEADDTLPENFQTHTIIVLPSKNMVSCWNKTILYLGIYDVVLVSHRFLFFVISIIDVNYIYSRFTVTMTRHWQRTHSNKYNIWPNKHAFIIYFIIKVFCVCVLIHFIMPSIVLCHGCICFITQHACWHSSNDQQCKLYNAYILFHGMDTERTVLMIK